MVTFTPQPLYHRWISQDASCIGGWVAPIAAVDVVQKRKKSLTSAGNRATIPRFPIPLSGPVMLVKLQSSRKLRFVWICGWWGTPLFVLDVCTVCALRLCFVMYGREHVTFCFLVCFSDGEALLWIDRPALSERHGVDHALCFAHLTVDVAGRNFRSLLRTCSWRSSPANVLEVSYLKCSNRCCYVPFNFSVGIVLDVLNVVHYVASSQRVPSVKLENIFPLDVWLSVTS